MIFERRDRAGPEVAGDTDFERNVFLPQMRQEPGIFDRTDSVADPLGADR